MLDEEVFAFDVKDISSKEEALAYLADKLIQKGVVKESYKQAILEREKVFPTALQFDGYGIAIPHTDVEHVNREQIAVMTLDKPVNFFQMGTTDQEVKVQVIFMLALKEAHSQLTMLQRLIELLQDKAIMEGLTHLKADASASELKALLGQKGIL